MAVKSPTMKEIEALQKDTLEKQGKEPNVNIAFTALVLKQDGSLGFPQIDELKKPAGVGKIVGRTVGSAKRVLQGKYGETQTRASKGEAPKRRERLTINETEIIAFILDQPDPVDYAGELADKVRDEMKAIAGERIAELEAELKKLKALTK